MGMTVKMWLKGQNYSELEFDEPMTDEDAEYTFDEPWDFLSGDDEYSGCRFRVQLCCDGKILKQRDYYLEPYDKAAADEEWRHEQAMEAGMLGGCDAYNEVMGW